MVSDASWGNLACVSPSALRPVRSSAHGLGPESADKSTSGINQRPWRQAGGRRDRRTGSGATPHLVVVLPEPVDGHVIDQITAREPIGPDIPTDVPEPHD